MDLQIFLKKSSSTVALTKIPPLSVSYHQETKYQFGPVDLAQSDHAATPATAQFPSRAHAPSNLLPLHESYRVSCCAPIAFILFISRAVFLMLFAIPFAFRVYCFGVFGAQAKLFPFIEIRAPYLAFPGSSR